MMYTGTQHSRFVVPQISCGARVACAWRKTRRNGVVSAFDASFATPPHLSLWRALRASQWSLDAFCAVPSRASGTLAPIVSRGRRGAGRVSRVSRFSRSSRFSRDSRWSSGSRLSRASRSSSLWSLCPFRPFRPFGLFRRLSPFGSATSNNKPTRRNQP